MTSNEINETMEAKFEKALLDIDSLKKKLSNEIKMTAALMVKIEDEFRYSKIMWSSYSLNRLSDAYGTYLRGHGIDFPQNVFERLSTFAKRLRGSLVDNEIFS